MSSKKTNISTKSISEKKTSSIQGKKGIAKSKKSSIESNIPELLESLSVTNKTIPHLLTVNEKAVLTNAEQIISHLNEHISKHEDPLEEKFMVMYNTDYKEVLVPEKDIEKRKEERWESIHTAFRDMGLKEPVIVSKRDLIETERRIHDLFKVLREKRLIYDAPYQLFSWDNIWNGLLDHASQKTIKDFLEADGIIVPYQYYSKKDLRWLPYKYSQDNRIDFYLVKETEKETTEENIKRIFNEYNPFNLQYWHEERERLDKIEKERRPDWVSATGLYYDFKAGKVYELDTDFSYKFIMKEMKE